MTLTWPERWQPEAIAAVLPYIDTEERLEILVDDPRTAISGTVIAGHVFARDDGGVGIIHDHSGRSDVYPWPLLSGPVLVVRLLRPRRRSLEMYRHPLWPRRHA